MADVKINDEYVSVDGAGNPTAWTLKVMAITDGIATITMSKPMPSASGIMIEKRRLQAWPLSAFDNPAGWKKKK